MSDPKSASPRLLLAVRMVETLLSMTAELDDAEGNAALLIASHMLATTSIARASTLGQSTVPILEWVQPICDHLAEKGMN